MNSERLNNIRYADDTVTFADSIEGLQDLMDNIVRESNNYGLELNIIKTKFTIISKNESLTAQLQIEGQVVQTVSTYTYLGTTINKKWDHSVEIKCRIEKPRNTL